MTVKWESAARAHFREMIAKVPVFMRGIAEDKVGQAAEKIAASDQRDTITEKDMVAAFFEATPFGFHGPMKADMEELGIDYRQYGFER